MDDTRYGRYYVYIKPIVGNPYVKTATPYIFSLVAIIIFVIFAIRPTILTINGLQKEIEEKQQILDTLTQNAENLTIGKRNLENLDPSVRTLIDTRLPDNGAVVSLVNNMQTTAPQGSSVSAFQVQPLTLYTASPTSKIKQNVGEVEFSFNIQSSYANLVQAINNLSESPRLIKITSIILNKVENQPLGLLISGKAFYLKEGAEK